MKRVVERVRGFRRNAGSALAEGFFRGFSRLGKLHPRARPEAHGVEVVTDIAYAEESAHAEHASMSTARATWRARSPSCSTCTEAAFGSSPRTPTG